jgi:hypothetical protein
LRLPLPAGIPSIAVRAPESTGDLEILGAKIIASGQKRELRLAFVCWRAGDADIPAFDVGGTSLGPYRVQAEPYARVAGSALRPHRGPLLLPGTRLGLAALAAALALLGLSGYGFAALALPWLRRRAAAARARKPYHRFLHDLRVARKRIGDGEPSRFYAYLSAAFRRYAAARFGPALAAMTPSELRRGGSPALGEPALALSALIARCDRARFAGERPGNADRSADLEALERSVGAIEGSRAEP